MSNNPNTLLEIKLNEITHLLDRMLLIGPPGIGKTERILQLAQKEAKEMGREFVDLRKADQPTMDRIISAPNKYYVFYRIVVSHVMPEDLSVPRINDNFVRFIPPQALYILSLPEIAGVLFLDEVTNVHRPDQLSSLLSFVYEKEVAWNIKLSDGVKIIMAGNPPRNSSIANMLPDPLITRSIVFYVSPPSPEEWINYMYSQYGNKWERIIGTFLLHYKHFIYYDGSGNEKNKNNDEMLGTGERLVNYATPRTWTTLATQLYNLKVRGVSYSSPFIRSLVVGSVGPYVANHLIPILTKDIDIEKAFRELIDNPSVVNVWDVSTRIIVASFLFEKLTELKDVNIEELLNELIKVNREFMLIAFLSMDDKKKVDWIIKYPFLLGKLSKNEFSGDIHDVIAKINFNASYA